MGNSEQTFKKILEVAYVMFSENGFDKTSLSMIAKEVGISKPAIYYYFQSKDQLIEYLFEEIYKEIKLEITFNYTDISKDNLIQKLLEIGYMSIEQQEKDIHFNKIFNQYMLLASRDEKYMKRLLELQACFLDGFYDLLKYAVQIEAICDSNIKAKAHMLAMVYDNIGNFMLTGIELDYKEIWQEAVDSVFREQKGKI
ncbi:TetR/AcrR family transcriptional regulator [Lysinibacillus agricola]|uniref:TetR/AcrR family transcriptional regulator n=1 Tax=Lysinibacillus agricola TaxID=2590012 RepID=A0ABX7AW83_9BACI|nr:MULTISPECIES: TetR/AcrR family transcriptional regulator [Lysinibacillus]KOS63429.1 TetR family transcriptional regulator [Lysinibacillus sp. FJAT-14222]QQP14233.1 TetR/AcrR family transcriptional regulator [Lysinibacillus agricola]